MPWGKFIMVNNKMKHSELWINFPSQDTDLRKNFSDPRIQFSSVAQSCPTFCDPMDCRMAGLPIHRQLPEFTQTHVHWVGAAIQPSHLLSSPSPPAFNLSQHQDLFQGVSSSHQAAKVLEFQFQHQSFQWIFRTDFLSNGLVGSPSSLRDSQDSSPTPQFKSISSSVLSFLYSPTLTSIHDYKNDHKKKWVQLSHWCHRIISCSVIPFSSCLWSFPSSGSFPMSQFFTSGGQSIGVSASGSILPMNIQDWYSLGLTHLIPLLSKGLSRVFSNTTVQKHQFFSAQPSLWSRSHIHTWLLEKR